MLDSDDEVSPALIDAVLKRQRNSWLDMAKQPDQYASISSHIGTLDAPRRLSPTDRQALTRQGLAAITRIIPDPKMAQSVFHLFGLESTSKRFSDERLKAADTEYQGRRTTRTPHRIREDLAPLLRDEFTFAVIKWAKGERPLAAPHSENLDIKSDYYFLEDRATAQTLYDATSAIARNDFSVVKRLAPLIRPVSELSTDRFSVAQRADAHLLYANARRDQGDLNGPDSASEHYAVAAKLAGDVHDLRLQARARLLGLGVVVEMGASSDKELRASGVQYLEHTTDPKLSEENRGWAYVWLGSVQTKLLQPQAALLSIDRGIKILNDEGNIGRSARFKLAGAQLAAGFVDDALHTLTSLSFFESVEPGTGGITSILQYVRGEKRLATVKLAQHSSFKDGAHTLARAATTARSYDLGHQQRSIAEIRDACRLDSGYRPQDHSILFDPRNLRRVS